MTGWTRASRVVVFGGSSLLLAGTAHRLGGGALPGAGVLGVTGFVLGLLGVVLTTRRLRFALVLPVLAVEQAGLHLLFHATSALPACSTVGAGGHAAAMPGMTTSMCPPGSMLPGAMPMASMPMASMHLGWSMLLAHLGATAATAWLLARGEVWCWRQADRVARAAALGPVNRPTLRHARVGWPALVRLSPPQHVDPAEPRGPPTCVAALTLPA